MGVGIGSFGLGRISIDSSLTNKDNLRKTEEMNIISNQNENGDKFSITQTQPAEERMYLASKNGKMYYSAGCGGANRIKEENKVWFSTKEEAEKSGYIMSLTCK